MLPAFGESYLAQCISTAPRLPCQQEGTARRGNPSVNPQAAGTQPSPAQATTSSKRGGGVLVKQITLYLLSLEDLLHGRELPYRQAKNIVKTWRDWKRPSGVWQHQWCALSRCVRPSRIGMWQPSRRSNGLWLGMAERGVTCVWHGSGVVREQQQQQNTETKG